MGYESRYMATVLNKTTGSDYIKIGPYNSPTEAFMEAMKRLAEDYTYGFDPEIPLTYHIEVRNRKTDNLVWETNWVGVTHLGPTPPCFKFAHPKTDRR